VNRVARTTRRLLVLATARTSGAALALGLFSLPAHAAPRAHSAVDAPPANDPKVTLAEESSPTEDSGTTAAGENAPTISLAEVLHHAAHDPPTVLAALATLQRIEAQESYAKAAWIPSLTAQATGGFVYDNRLIFPNTPRIDSKALSVQGNATVEWAALSVERGANIDAAKANTRAQKFAEHATERAALVAAAELYIRAGAATELVKDAELTVQRRTEENVGISGLAKLGMRPPVDAQRSEVEAVSARYALEARRDDALAAYAALAVALGRSPTDPVRPETTTTTVFSVSIHPAEAQRVAMKNRPEIRSLVASVVAARESYNAAIGARYPTVGVSTTATVSYSDVLSGLGIPGYQYGGQAVGYVRWSGLDPSVWQRASVTEAAIAEAQHQLEATVLTVQGEAVGASYTVNRAKTDRDSAVAVLSLAQVTREAQDGRYRTGNASLLDLLDAENLEQQARQRRIEAERDYEIAGARLLAACGLLGRFAE